MLLPATELGWAGGLCTDPRFQAFVPEMPTFPRTGPDLSRVSGL